MSGNEHRVLVTLHRDGSVTAHTQGIVGPACLDVIPLLEDLLAGEVIESAFTADFTTLAQVSERPSVQPIERANLENQE